MTMTVLKPGTIFRAGKGRAEEIYLILPSAIEHWTSLLRLRGTGQEEGKVLSRHLPGAAQNLLKDIEVLEGWEYRMLVKDGEITHRLIEPETKVKV